jgi:hypothetical protein
MVFCLHANLLGSGEHMVITEDGLRGAWSADIPDDALVFTGEHKDSMCLDTVIRLSAGEAAFEVPQPYRRAARIAFGDAVCPMWRAIMPKRAFECAVRHLVQQVVGAYSRDAMRYYVTTWELVGRFLQGLQPFTFEGDGAQRTVTYDRLRTRTGRMVVAAGPPIMTMPRDQRRTMRSLSGRRLKYVDFRALEPTIIANQVGARFEGSDLYAWLACNVMHGRDRNAAKQAVVQALYGGAHGRTVEAQRIAQWFCVPDLAKRIRASARGEVVINAYGRSIASESFGDDGCVINDYTQSTAVDAAILGFDAVCSEHEAVPIAIIHDAVIVDDVLGKLADGHVGSVVVNGVGLLYYKVTEL